MFGYIKPYLPELKVYEYGLYRAFYCGICRSIGNISRASARLRLSYDYVFAALLFAAASDETIEIEKGRCPLHPIKKREFTAKCRSVEKTAEVFSVLNYYKALDDKNDRENTAAARVTAKRYLSKIKKIPGIETLAGQVESSLTEINERERNGIFAPTQNAESFGTALGHVFAYGEEDKAGSRVLFEIGRRTGRWIYLIDAADDFESDKKKGRYNPFGDCDKFPKDEIDAALEIEQMEAATACNLIDCKNKSIMNIIYNILTLGMSHEAERVLNKEKKTEEKDEQKSI